MKAKLLLCLVLALSGALSGCTMASISHPAEKRLWGNVTDGLQMSLIVFRTDKDYPLLQIAIWNVGNKDVQLNLGRTLANRKVLIPDNIGLILTDSNGKRTKLDFADARFPAANGGKDDYVVLLKSGSTYALVLHLEEFISETTGDSVNLTPGRYVISSQFQGVSADGINADMDGTKLPNFWRGKLQSNDAIIYED
ncbi:MAG: hypothetical protein ABSE48_18230 [Verrucomicrobiota bacterium]|jgi:hypothetical protein